MITEPTDKAMYNKHNLTKVNSSTLHLYIKDYGVAVLFIACLASTYASWLHGGAAVLHGPGNPGAVIKGPAASGGAIGPDGSHVAGGGDAGAVAAGPIPGGVVTIQSLHLSNMRALVAVLFIACLASTYASWLHGGAAVLHGPGNPGAVIKGPAASGGAIGPDGSHVAGGGDAGAVAAGPIPGGVVTGAVAPGGIAVGHGGLGLGLGGWGGAVVAPAAAWGAGHWGGGWGGHWGGHGW